MSTWYLSFATETEFLGAVVVEASDMVHAVTRAHVLRLNPGGHVSGVQLPETWAHPDWMNRLLSRDEALALPE